MAVKTFSVGETLTASDTNTYLANAGLVVVTPSSVTNGTLSGAKVTVGTTVTSVTVSGVFSATFDNYRIVYSGGAGSTNDNLYLQLSGSTGNTYSTSGWFMTPGTATLNAYSPAATSKWLIGPVNSTRNGFIADLLDPYASRQTMGSTSGFGTGSAYQFLLSDTSTASSTGFTLSITTAGQTISGGTIMIYGYRLG